MKRRQTPAGLALRVFSFTPRGNEVETDWVWG
jgi:hypothetical protein